MDKLKKKRQREFKRERERGGGKETLRKHVEYRSTSVERTQKHGDLAKLEYQQMKYEKIEEISIPTWKKYFEKELLTENQEKCLRDTDTTNMGIGKKIQLKLVHLEWEYNP